MSADTFALSVHATWRCRHSGVCCSSGWPIPVDAVRRGRLEAALREGAIAAADGGAPLVVADAVADPPIVLLGVTQAGHCAFHDTEAHRCDVQRALGHDALPLACRMFPRVTLSDARGVRVSLSHYCPSAAARLFEEDEADRSVNRGADGEGDADAGRDGVTRLAIVRAPAAFPADGEYDGLDAREAFPPLLRPGVLLDWETADALEAFGVACFADTAATGVEAALERFAAACETLRAWRAVDGPLIDGFRALTSPTAPAVPASSASSRTDASPSAGESANATATANADWLEQGDGWARTSARDAEVRACVPAGVPCPAAPAEVAARDAFARHVAPVWPAMARPVGRYLAARLFGAWCWYQGQGLRSLVRSLDAALAVLRVEAARQTMATGRMLDRDQMREAIRQADLLGLHLASRDALAARWSAAEREGLRP